jgi:hypothetical protein
MDQRDEALIHYVVIMTIHNDARKMASTLRNQFTAEERQEIKELTDIYANYAVTSKQQEAFRALRGMLP